MDFLKDFGVQPVLLAAQVVNFLILLFILKKFLYGPILKVLETRKKTIEQSLKNAEEIEKRLIEIGELQEKEIMKAAKKGEEIIKDASEYGNEIMADAHVQVQKIVDKATKQTQLQLVRDKQEFEQSLRENVVDLVTTLVQKITGKILTDKDRKRVIEESLKNLKS